MARIRKDVIIEIICFLLIILFVYAAIMKLSDVEKFKIQIGRSPMLTDFAGVAAWLIPISELLIAVMLVIKKFRTTALYGAFILMVIFTTYIVVILNFSEKIPCSCGGVLEMMGWTEHLIFNIAYVIIALIGILLDTGLRSTRPSTAIPNSNFSHT